MAKQVGRRGCGGSCGGSSPDPDFREPTIAAEVEVPIPTLEAVSSRKEKEPSIVAIRVVVIEKERSRLPFLFQKL